MVNFCKPCHIISIHHGLNQYMLLHPYRLVSLSQILLYVGMLVYMVILEFYTDKCLMSQHKLK